MNERAARQEILIVRLLGVALLLFGCLFIALGGQRFARYRRTAGWATVAGEVISPPPHIRYSYRVNGAIYHGTRVRMDDVRPRLAAAPPVIRYDSGRAALTILYDPDHPESAVLERESLAASVVLTAVGLAPILLGALLLRWRRRYAARVRAAAARSGRERS